MLCVSVAQNIPGEVRSTGGRAPAFLGLRVCQPIRSDA